MRTENDIRGWWSVAGGEAVLDAWAGQTPCLVALGGLRAAGAAPRASAAWVSSQRCHEPAKKDLVRVICAAQTWSRRSGSNRRPTATRSAHSGDDAVYQRMDCTSGWRFCTRCTGLAQIRTTCDSTSGQSRLIAAATCPPRPPVVVRSRQSWSPFAAEGCCKPLLPQREADGPDSESG